MNLHPIFVLSLICREIFVEGGWGKKERESFQQLAKCSQKTAKLTSSAASFCESVVAGRLSHSNYPARLKWFVEKP